MYSGLFPTASGSDELEFDSAAWPADERFDRYHALYDVMTEALLTGPAMRAHVRAWRLDRMLLYDRRLHDVGHRRVPSRLAADGFDHFAVTLLLSGSIAFRYEDQTRSLRAGEAILLSTAIPYENRMQDAHLVTISVARERLAAITGDVDALHGLVLSAGEVRLFREFVEVLLRNLPGMAPSAAGAAADVLTTLLTVAIDSSGIDRAAGKSAQAERLAQLRRVIDADLGDPAFDIAAMVRRSGLSRSTIYRALEPYGGFQAYIRGRRLEHLRRRLASPAETRSFTALASEAGFADTNNANRAFFERYDIRPGQYRGIIRTGVEVDNVPTLRLWLDELR